MKTELLHAMRGSWRKVRVGDNVWQGLPVVIVPKMENESQNCCRKRL